MFNHNNSKSAAHSKEKTFSKSPILNQLGYTNPQDSIINNYNVKVNITKKKTKNISIGNLTLGNLNIVKGKELCNLQLTNNKLDNYIQKSENISPKSNEKTKHHQQFFNPDIKNANTVLNSPKQSYNKIISKMKKEFEKIASRTHSKNNTNEDNTTNTNEDDNNCNKKKINDNSKNAKESSIKPVVNFAKGIKINPLNTNSNNLINITSHKILLKPHLTTNYSRKPKNRKNNNNIESYSNNNLMNMSSYNNNKINGMTTYLNLSSILNTKDITTVDKSLMQICKEATLNYNNAYSSSELHTALMAMSNDLSLEKEAHSQTIQELKDSQLAIRLLNEYIKSQQEVYLQEAKRHQVMLMYKKHNNINDKQNPIINELVQQNKELKGIIYKMLFFIEKDYFEKNSSYNRIETIVTQLIKENAYLRNMAFNIKSIYLLSASTLQDKDIANFVKGKNHKRQDTQIVYSSDPDCQMKKEDIDHLSYSMKEMKSLKKTMQKEILNNTPTNHYWYDAKEKSIFIKRPIYYLKKR